MKPLEEIEESPLDAARPVSTPEVDNIEAWNVEEARNLISRMNEKALHLTAPQVLPTTILQTMAYVQECSLDLSRRAEVARKATATLKAAVEVLFGDGKTLEDDDNHLAEPNPATLDYAKHLRERLLTEIEEEGDVEGPDAEELEEECKELEKLLANQQKQIEMLYRQREKSQRKVEVEDPNAKAETMRSLTECEPTTPIKADDAADETSNSKSVVGTQKGVGLMKFKTIAKLSRLTKKSSAPQKADSDEEVPLSKGNKSFERDPKVMLLRESIAIKDAELQKAQRLLQRMRRERRLLRYCARKAQQPFDELTREFNPPNMSLDDGEILGSDQDFDDEDELPPQVGFEALDDAGLDDDLEDGPVAPRPEINRPGHRKTMVTSSAANKSASLVDRVISAVTAQHGLPGTSEEEIKIQIAEFKDKVSAYAKSLKEEKNKQKSLKKDIQDLKKEFIRVSRSSKAVPPTVEGLQGALDKERAEEQRIRTAISQALMELQTQTQALAQLQEDDRAAVEASQAAAAAAEAEAKRVTLEAQKPTSYLEDMFDPIEEPPLDRRRSPVTTMEQIPILVTLEEPPKPIEVIDAQAEEQTEVQRKNIELFEKGWKKVQNPEDAEERPEKPPPQKDQQNAALIELVRVQRKNEEMKAEIRDADHKLKLLKQAMKKGRAGCSVEVIKAIMGAHEMEEVRAPPEYFRMKKEVRQQQEKVRSLRKRWHADHKEFDAIVAAVRHEATSNPDFYKAVAEPTATVRPQNGSPALSRMSVGFSGVERVPSKDAPIRRSLVPADAEDTGSLGVSLKFDLGVSNQVQAKTPSLKVPGAMQATARGSLPSPRLKIPFQAVRLKQTKATETPSRSRPSFPIALPTAPLNTPSPQTFVNRVTRMEAMGLKPGKTFASVKQAMLQKENSAEDTGRLTGRSFTALLAAGDSTELDG